MPFPGIRRKERGAFNRIKNVQGLIAMNPDKPFTRRINHQIHRLERQRAGEYVLRGTTRAGSTVLRLFH
jgi:hypothetical protein